MFYQEALGAADPEATFCCTFPVSLRLCRRADLRDLEWFGMFRPDRHVIEQAFAHQQEGKNLMFLADANRFPIGQVWIKLAEKGSQGVGVLWALRVLPPFQSQGIGTRLIAYAESELAARGFQFAELSVARDNPRAKKLYQRLGYKIAHSEEDAAENEWTLRKSLKPVAR